MTKLKSVKTKPKTQKFFYMAAILATYKNEAGEPRQRHFNVMLETDSVNIRREELASFNEAALARIHAENGVTEDRIGDIVFMSICPLGVMESEEFHGATTLAEPETAPAS